MGAGSSAEVVSGGRIRLERRRAVERQLGLRWWSRGVEIPSVCGQPNMFQDSRDARSRRHGSHDRHASGTAGTRENVFQKHPPDQRRPREPTRPLRCFGPAAGRPSGHGAVDESRTREITSHWSAMVSRVLSRRSLPSAGGDHSSGPSVAGRLVRPTRDLGSTRATSAGFPAASTWSCTGWGFPCPDRHRSGGALLPHLFTLAAGLLPARQRFHFLWHCPSSLLDWPLASTLPCGARTFLDRRLSALPRSPLALQRETDTIAERGGPTRTRRQAYLALGAGASAGSFISSSQ